MSAIQTEYKDYMPEGYEGAVANMRQRDFISRTCEDAGITKFGRAVAKGTTDRTVTTNLTGKTSIVGVTVLDRGALRADRVLPDPDRRGHRSEACGRRRGRRRPDRRRLQSRAAVLR